MVLPLLTVIVSATQLIEKESPLDKFIVLLGRCSEILVLLETCFFTSETN